MRCEERVANGKRCRFDATFDHEGKRLCGTHMRKAQDAPGWLHRQIEMAKRQIEKWPDDVRVAMGIEPKRKRR